MTKNIPDKLNYLFYVYLILVAICISLQARDKTELCNILSLHFEKHLTNCSLPVILSGVLHKLIRKSLPLYRYIIFIIFFLKNINIF